MDKVFINLVIGVILLMSSNILMGSADALIGGQFDWNKFLKGVGKAVVISVAFGLALLAGELNPDIMVMTLGDTDVNIIAGFHMTLVASFIWYGAQVINKLRKFIVPTKEK